MKKNEILASIEEMFKGKKLIFLVFALLLFFSGCIGSRPVEEQVSEPLEAPALVSLPNETVSDAVVEKEASVERKKCNREFKPKFSSDPHYTGPLFDAHFHMPNLISFSEIGELAAGHAENSITDPVLGRDVELDKILCIFEMENTKGAIGFSIGAEEALKKTLDIAKLINKNSSGKIKLFLMPATFSTGSLDNIQTSDKGLFKGYGEIAFYDPSYANKPPNSNEMLEIYKIAEKHNLIVMFHPAARQESEVENAIQKNPNVKFILHGPEIEGSITNLISKYPNVYYSIDATLVRFNSPGALLYTSSGKENFKSTFTKNYDTILNNAVNDWKEKIEQYPDRFMWGTDRGHKWTYDEDVSALLEEFGRNFIAKLNPSVQEKFAYKNAEKLLQE